MSQLVPSGGSRACSDRQDASNATRIRPRVQTHDAHTPIRVSSRYHANPVVQPASTARIMPMHRHRHSPESVDNYVVSHRHAYHQHVSAAHPRALHLSRRNDRCKISVGVSSDGFVGIFAYFPGNGNFQRPQKRTSRDANAMQMVWVGLCYGRAHCGKFVRPQVPSSFVGTSKSMGMPSDAHSPHAAPVKMTRARVSVWDPSATEIGRRHRVANACGRLDKLSK